MSFSEFNPPEDGSTLDENGNPIYWTVDTKMEWIRFWRNSMLNKTDWTMMPDNGLTEEKREEWRIYRQELRNLPSASDPEDATPPIPPEA